MNEQQMFEAILPELDASGPCVLCGQMTGNHGLFLAENPGTFGAAEGKYRVVLYLLCKDHEPCIATFEEVESILKVWPRMSLQARERGRLM